MSNLRKAVAALGFVCFFSLALLPVGMSICEPLTWQLFHHGKHAHQMRARPEVFHRLHVAQPHGSDVQRDILPEEDSLRNLPQYTGIARSPAGAEPDNREPHVGQGFVESARVSSFDSHTVLIL
jgi:hypothetical protein